MLLYFLRFYSGKNQTVHQSFITINFLFTLRFFLEINPAIKYKLIFKSYLPL